MNTTATIDAFRPADGPPPQTLGAFFRWCLAGAWPALWLAAGASALAGSMEVVSALLLGWVIDAALASPPGTGLQRQLVADRGVCGGSTVIASAGDLWPVVGSVERADKPECDALGLVAVCTAGPWGRP